MPHKVVYIYALIDPRTNEVRYIGKTTDPKGRLYEHTKKSDLATHKAHWINQLRAEGLRPRMEILEETTAAKWEKRERHWIAYGKAQGWRLTNIRAGGNPTKEETRAIDVCGTVGEAVALYVEAELRSVYDLLPPDAKLAIGQAAARAVLPYFDQFCRACFEGSTKAQDLAGAQQAHSSARSVVNRLIIGYGNGS